MLGNLRASKGFYCNGQSILAVLAVATICISSSVLNAAQAVIEKFHSSPAVFISNQGQWDDSVKYVHKGDGAEIAHTNNGIVFSISKAVGGKDITAELGIEDVKTEGTSFSVSFIGAKNIDPVGIGESQTKFNFLIGKQENWKQNVSGFEKVAYKDLYKGIDLHTWGQRDSLKYEFHVAPGADYKQIALSYKGIKGLSIADNGTLIVSLPGSWGKMVDDKPYIYQVVDGKKIEVEGKFILLSDNSYTFEIAGEYDATRELIIDPDIEWSSYLGGTGLENGYAVAIDSSGNVLVTGATESDNWDGVISGTYDNSFSASSFPQKNSDGYVVKFSPSGTHIWSTYLGGSNYEHGRGITVNSSDDVFATGLTKSDDWFSGVDNTSHVADSDAFVIKLSSTGNFVWGTYFGGTENEYGNDIAIDTLGKILITGDTTSPNLVSGNYINQHGLSWDGFVAKFSSTGYEEWSAYLGGSNQDYGKGIDTDSINHVYVTGGTFSNDWKDNSNSGMSGGERTDHANTSQSDGFLIKFTPDGYLEWSTYIGDYYNDKGYDVKVDSSDNIVVVGSTTSGGWVPGGNEPSPIPPTPYSKQGVDGFVIKYSPACVIRWGIALGGNGHDICWGVTTDIANNIFVIGDTVSTDNWVSGGWKATNDPINNVVYRDAFVVKLAYAGGHEWSSYMGGTEDDFGYGIDVDSSGNIYVIGSTHSDCWGTIGAWDTTFGTSTYGDGYIAMIDDIAPEVTEDPKVNNDVSQRDSIKTISFTFTEDVDIDTSDLLIYHHNGTSWNQVTLSGLTFNYNSNDYTATWAGSPIVDAKGYYVAKLNSTSVEDLYGNALVDDFYRFHVLAGDIDGDKNQDVDDIDLLDEKLRAADSDFDINHSGAIDYTDVDYLVVTQLETFFGDLDLDGDVDIYDFLALKDNYSAQGDWTEGDLDCDGDADILDFLILKDNYGESNTNFALDALGSSVPAWP